MESFFNSVICKIENSCGNLGKKLNSLDIGIKFSESYNIEKIDETNNNNNDNITIDIKDVDDDNRDVKFNSIINEETDNGENNKEIKKQNMYASNYVVDFDTPKESNSKDIIDNKDKDNASDNKI